MLQTSYGFMPWDDTHHPKLSQTDGVPDGRWLFINGNNTPRVARIDLTRFETDEILEIPNSAGGHASPFTTPNSKYIVVGDALQRADPEQGRADRQLQGELHGHAVVHHGATSRARWTSRSRSSCPASTTTSARRQGPVGRLVLLHHVQHRAGYTKLEANASKNDKDFIAAVNCEAAEQCVAEGKAKTDAGEVHAQLHRREVAHRATRESRRA